MITYNPHGVELYFQERAEIFKTLQLENGVVVYWKGAQSIPTMKAISFFLENGEKEIIPNRSENEFRLFFKKVRPKLSEIETICELIHWGSPYLRRVILKLPPHLNNIIDIWYAPRIADNGERFEGYFSNMGKGVVENIAISKTYDVVIEEVCQGLRF